MNEEEIINYFKQALNWYRENTPNRVYVLNNKDIEMIQGLLDLYNKEKMNSSNLSEQLNKEKEKNNNILGLVFQYGQIDGEHHKTWVIDQIVKTLTGENYEKWVQHYEYDEETGEEYEWDTGIAP